MVKAKGIRGGATSERGKAGNGKANQRGERLKHVRHPQRGTYKTEQRTATIKQPTALQWAAMQGNARI